MAFSESTEMSKLLALDLGDQWVGVAITDASQTFVRPLTTATATDLVAFLEKTLKTEQIQTVVVGYPKTMGGRESDQTLKILAQKEALEIKFPTLQFVLWDERLSSQRASMIGSRKTKEDKLKSHALAAAFILDSYVTFLKNSSTEL